MFPICVKEVCIMRNVLIDPCPRKDFPSQLIQGNHLFQVRSSQNQKELKAGPWHLHVQSNQQRLFGLIRMSHKNISLWTYSLNSQLEEDPWANPEHTGGITYPIWPGKASGSPKRSQSTWLGRRTLPCLLPLLIKMDGRIKSHSLWAAASELCPGGFLDLMFSYEIKLDFLVDISKQSV